MSRNRLAVLVGIYVLVGVAVLLGVGWIALLVYLFLLGLVLAIAIGATAGGDWLRDASARRFDDRDR